MSGFAKVLVALGMAGSFVTGTLVARTRADDHFQGRTFGHVGIVVRDVEKSARMFSQVWGVPMPPIARNRRIPFPPDYTGNRDARVKLAMIQLDNITFELLEPINGGPSPWHDHLQQFGEGLHHVAFRVDDLAGSIRTLQGFGGKWIQGGVEGAPFAYVDMKPQLGFVVELNQSAPAVPK